MEFARDLVVARLDSVNALIYLFRYQPSVVLPLNTHCTIFYTAALQCFWGVTQRYICLIVESGGNRLPWFQLKRHNNSFVGQRGITRGRA
jgi:hypothetical protein